MSFYFFATFPRHSMLRCWRTFSGDNFFNCENVKNEKRASFFSTHNKLFFFFFLTMLFQQLFVPLKTMVMMMMQQLELLYQSISINETRKNKRVYVASQQQTHTERRNDIHTTTTRSTLKKSCNYIGDVILGRTTIINSSSSSQEK